MKAQFGMACAMLAASCAYASPDAYPAKPIRMLVPSAAGSAPDTVARIVADRMGRSLNQPIVIDNKPGAGGAINMNALRQTPADGYTISIIQGAVAAVTPFTYKTAKYDLDRDFAIVSMIANTPMMITANTALPAKTLGEAIALAKTTPEKVTLGSSTRGSIPNLANELLVSKTGAKFQIVPFATSGQGIQATIGGDVNLFTDGVAPLIPLVKAGRLRALAVASDTVLPGLEGIPLAKDTVPGFNVYGWFVLVAPKGTPKPILDRLNKEANAAVADPAVIDKLKQLGTYPRSGTSSDAQAFVRSEVKVFGELIKATGIQAE